MKPICINNYCFDHVHIWIQYDHSIPQFVEVAIEIFYPRDRQANGLVMFNHGFLIGVDLLYYPKKIIGSFLNDTPLFGVHPSYYYNYSNALVEKNWAMAYVTSTHMQMQGVPWTDFGGNPRVGQEAYAAASYLIKYGVTDEFYKAEKKYRNTALYKPDDIEKARFMRSNNVIFAGHSVGGAHAQVPATGFETMRKIGEDTCRPFDPVIYDREFLPKYSERMSEWAPEERANPVGLVQLSPVDQKVPLIGPGMADYRKVLAERELPILMIIGECDSACLKDSVPPAWSPNPDETTEFSQLAPEGSNSWAVVANVEKGSHCGYLTKESDLCSLADVDSGLCKEGTKTWKAGGQEAAFTNELFKQFIAMYPDGQGFQGDFKKWIHSDFIKWLNRENPYGKINMVPFADGKYIDYSSHGGCPPLEAKKGKK
ncbi:hypothetical protein CR164_08820 [Prosthecochloris marina]|uniref:Alpha/beta hydrolase n=1 Tax=Prosthecochloris marina TaxID=2017681 RepID=A0A317T5G6_9CHLB|nr:hypothetical protein [Prosthecochloris marina]PWW81903.1 hypothetical protein CR164_08820 [Prosthecochloris marina]